MILIHFFFLFQSGATPLFISSQEGHIEVVKELIKGKANIDAPTKVSGIFVFVTPRPPFSFSPFSLFSSDLFLLLVLFLFLFLL